MTPARGAASASGRRALGERRDPTSLAAGRHRPRLGASQAAQYAAEEEALADRGIRWVRLGDAQAYLDRLVASEWFGECFAHFGGAEVRRRGSGSRWSLALPLDDAGPDGRPTAGLVLLAEGALCQRVLLHELAHLLAPLGSEHGEAFVGVHLELVRREMGFFAFAEYRRALTRRGFLSEGPAPSGY
jgi:hypothetical protein